MKGFRTVKPGIKERFLPGSVEVEIVKPESQVAQNWFVCRCYAADKTLIDTAVFSRSYIEFHSK